jgi:hypothetical protein
MQPNPFFDKINAKPLTVEKSCPTIMAASVIKKAAESKQSPDG